MARPAKTQNDAQVADPVDALPAVTMSGKVSAVLSEAVELYRWGNRKSRADVLHEALTDFATKHDLHDRARASLQERIDNPDA